MTEQSVEMVQYARCSVSDQDIRRYEMFLLDKERIDYVICTVSSMLLL